MKKTLFTLAVDNYAPEITELTFPLMRTYAHKIGADFHVITERRHPEWPAAMEKLQVYDLAREMGNDWNLFLDADALVHPECFDITEHLTKDTVLHHGLDRSTVRFTPDRFVRRDGRFVAPGNWLAVASDWCIELWDFPTDLTPDEAAAAIHPTVGEALTGVDRRHLMDDYIVGRNRAKYGLKLTTFQEVCARLELQPVYFWHEYTIPNDVKVERIKATLAKWRLL
jgi:hypothetical protein